MTDTKTVNYTDEMVADMTERYEADPTLDNVKAIAADFGKSTKSIVAKLVSLGIYQKAERKTKNGQPIIQKAALVKQIEAHYGFEMPSLVKATKADLQHLASAIN